MIYFYNQSEFTANWQQAYQQLNSKLQNLAKDYTSAIQLRQKINQKILNLTKENQNIKAKRLEKEFQTLEKESSSYVPVLKANGKVLTSKNVKKSTPKIRRQFSQSISAKEEGLIYQCTYQGCHKTYTTPVSMNLHIKQKHNGGTKRERQAYARMVLEAQEKGEQIPDFDINLPPNFLEEYRTFYEYMKKYSM